MRPSPMTPVTSWCPSWVAGLKGMVFWKQVDYIGRACPPGHRSGSGLVETPFSDIFKPWKLLTVFRTDAMARRGHPFWSTAFAQFRASSCTSVAKSTVVTLGSRESKRSVRPLFSLGTLGRSIRKRRRHEICRTRTTRLTSEGAPGGDIRGPWTHRGYCMRRDGFQDNEHPPAPDRSQPRSSAFVNAGLVGVSFAVGAIGTLLFLTGGSVQPLERLATAVDTAFDTLSSKAIVRGRDVREGPEGDPRPAASPPPISSSPSGALLPASGAETPPRDWVDRTAGSLSPPASSLPRTSRSSSSELEPALDRRFDGVEALFEVPIGGHVTLPVKTKTVDPAYPRIARKARNSCEMPHDTL